MNNRFTNLLYGSIQLKKEWSRVADCRYKIDGRGYEGQKKNGAEVRQGRDKALVIFGYCSREMALLSSTPSLSFASPSHPPNSNWGIFSFTFHTTQFARRQRPIASSHLSSTLDTNPIDKSFLNLAEAFSEEELWAAACLRVRSFYEFRPSAYGIRVSPRLSFHLFCFLGYRGYSEEN